MNSNRKDTRRTSIWDMGKRRPWKKTIWNLSRSYGRKERFRTVSISVTILIITILFTSLLTLFVGVELSVGRYEIEHYGTKAHGQVFNVSKTAYDVLKADEEVKDAAYSRMVGILSLEMADTKRYYFCYDERKSMEWEGISIAGKYPAGEHDIVVGTHFLQVYGMEKKVNQSLRLSYTTMGEEHTETFHIVGYYPSRQTASIGGFYDGNHEPGTFEKIYVSQKFCSSRLSGYSEKEIEKYFDADKTNGDGLYQVQIQFPHKFHLSKQARSLEKKYRKYLVFSGVFLNGGWTRIDPMGWPIGNYFVLFMAALAISLVGIFVINSIFQIPIVEDSRFWGLLQTLGVSCEQYRYFLFLQMQTYAIYGILLGGLAGYAVGWALIPLITNNFYAGEVVRYMPFQPWIPGICIAAGFLISYICCFRVARRVAGLSPVDMERLREESIGARGKKRLYLGKYRDYRFAWNMVKASKSKTKAVAASFTFLLLVVMMVTTFLRSINYTYYMQGQLGGLDFIVLSKNATNSARLEECSLALEALEECCGLKGSRIGKSEEDLVLYDEFAPEGQKEIFDTTQVRKYLSENALLNSHLPGDQHVACLSLFGFDSEIVQRMNIVQGEIDAEKYETGDYVILLSKPETGEREGVTEEYKNPLYALYGIGDMIELYGKKYKVMAVADMPSVLCSYDYANELPVIMPYREAAKRTDTFHTYGEVYRSEDLGNGDARERIVNYILTDREESLDYVSRDTVEAQLKALSNMMYAICLLVVVFITVVLMIHAVNVTSFSIQNERHILAVLQSIGMQRQQQRRQLCWENVFLLCLSCIMAVMVGSVLSLTVVRNLCDSTAVCRYRYSVLPVVAVSVLLAAGMSASAIVSYDSIWKKYSMMDLLKEKV